jgi:hypothetical protein
MRISERGARMARGTTENTREYLREEQRSQPGCPARKPRYKSRGQATSSVRRHAETSRGCQDRAHEVHKDHEENKSVFVCFVIFVSFVLKAVGAFGEGCDVACRLAVVFSTP